MKTKYAKLIEQLERATEVYDAAVQAAKKSIAVIDGLDDVLGVSGAIVCVGGSDTNRAIHVRSDCFTQAALDCGTGFKMEHLEHYTQFECSMFGYRVFALFRDDEEGYAELMEKVKEDE